MAYVLQEQYTSNNFTPAAQVPAVFDGYQRDVQYITIHHWGVNGQQFDVVRNFLCTNTTPTSAHFVVQAGLVACIVDPDDAAWHAGNARGNAQSIGIECHPEATDGDYQTIGELVAYLRGIYGDVPLVPHNYWTSTACPGDYDLGRIDSIARGVTTPAITPTQEDTLSAQAEQQIQAIFNRIKYLDAPVSAVPGKAAGAVWSTPVHRGTANVPALQELADAKTGILTASASLAALAGAPAGTVALTDAQVTTLANTLKAELPAATLAAITAQWNK